MRRFFHHARGTLTLDGPPILFGILNVTPDSFSDGGKFDATDRAIAHAAAMLADGADVIDVGGESTRPGAAEVAAEVEAARVVPVVTEIARRGATVSIDTRKATVAQAALRAGAAIVNDVSGLAFDPAMPRLVAESKAGVVIMHSRGTPATMARETKYVSVIDDIVRELGAAVDLARTAGVKPEAIAIDPGIGFAKTPAQSLEILAHLARLIPLGFPILVGPSRKSFIGHVTGKSVDDRLWGTAAAVAIAVAKGAVMLRAHDVSAMRDVARVAHAIVAAAGPAQEPAP